MKMINNYKIFLMNKNKIIYINLINKNNIFKYLKVKINY
jgi:hypothetical protein